MRILTLLLSIFIFSRTNAQDSIPDDLLLTQLKLDIKQVLEETNAPGVGIALVDENGPVWVEGLGKRNLENDLIADENSIYRLASISKIFVALSILKLQDEGKLSLDDIVRDLVPEIKFSNQWEETDPVRIVHLLEHTTGWDDLHPVESRYNDSLPFSLVERLAVHPHSRTSEWVPGSRYAYCNVGYAVAGYVVEKVSGMNYEEYVQENFLNPIGMKHTTFFHDALFQDYGVTNYDFLSNPRSYHHILFRPAGALNASPADLAKLLTFFINGGIVDSMEVMTSKLLERMRIPASATPAKGIELGYGLGHDTNPEGEFIYYGHDGALRGSYSQFRYLPNHKMGYAILLNQANREALIRISGLVRIYQTSQLKSSYNKKEKYSGDLSHLNGLYVNINPRIQSMYYLDHLFDIHKIRLENGVLTDSWLLGGRSTLYDAVSDTTFMSRDHGKIGMVVADDPLVGQVLYSRFLIYKPISFLVVYGQFGLLILWLFFMGIGAFFLLYHLLEFLRKGSKSGLLVTILPSVSSLMFVIVLIFTRVGLTNFDRFIAQPSFISISVFIATIIFILSTIGSFYLLYRDWKMNGQSITFWQNLILSSLHGVVLFYLLWFGVIPVATWSY